MHDISEITFFFLAILQVFSTLDLQIRQMFTSMCCISNGLEIHGCSASATTCKMTLAALQVWHPKWRSLLSESALLAQADVLCCECCALS